MAAGEIVDLEQNVSNVYAQEQHRSLNIYSSLYFLRLQGSNENENINGLNMLAVKYASRKLKLQDDE